MGVNHLTNQDPIYHFEKSYRKECYMKPYNAMQK